MSKLEQILIIEPPSILRFKGPFTNTVTTDLILKNPSERRVCFKVQTTAPHRYCVRPNSGLIEAGADVKISITLQPLDRNNEKSNKDKFMVKSIVVPPNVSDTDSSLWEDANPDDFMETKLRCAFELPSENDTVKQENDATKAVPLMSSTNGDIPCDLTETKLSCDFELPSESYRAKRESHVVDATKQAVLNCTTGDMPTAATVPAKPYSAFLDDTEVKKLAKPASASLEDTEVKKLAKPTTSASLNNTEKKKLLETCKRLQAEISNLAEENRQLKDGLRMRGLSLSGHVTLNPTPAEEKSCFITRVDREASTLSLASCLIVVSAIYIGLFIGKFML